MKAEDYMKNFEIKHEEISYYIAGFDLVEIGKISNSVITNKKLQNAFDKLNGNLVEDMAANAGKSLNQIMQDAYNKTQENVVNKKVFSDVDTEEISF